MSALADQEVEFELLELESDDADADEVAAVLAVVLLLVDAADLAAMFAPRPRNRTTLSAPATTRDRTAAWRGRRLGRRRAWRGGGTGARLSITTSHVLVMSASSLPVPTGAELREAWELPESPVRCDSQQTPS